LAPTEHGGEPPRNLVQISVEHCSTDRGMRPVRASVRESLLESVLAGTSSIRDRI
jgi:hypothetical protein